MLREEIVRFLVPYNSQARSAGRARPGAVLVDAAVGDGGHAAALLTASEPDGRLLGIDLDPGALAVARTTLAPFGERVKLVQGTFADIARSATAEGFGEPTGVLFDLGLRHGQLAADRGFAFRGASALDMRFDPTGTIALPEPTHPALRRLARERGAYTAAEVLRFLSTEALADILRTYGDERFARRIANAIVATRARTPIHTTNALVSVVIRALPPRARHGRTHAATRTFQALRIAVNREWESLEAGVRGTLRILAPEGRVAVIAYHSGEDRIVKRLFREAAEPRRVHGTAAATGAFALVTPHPRTPSSTERAANPRSRSAKLRVLTRLSTP